MIQLNPLYTQHYPLTSHLLPNTATASLNLLAKKIFTEPKTNFVLQEAKQHKTYADLQNYHISHLQKEIADYTKNEQKKLFLSAAVIAACIVGIAVHPIFGFAALGAAITLTIFYYPTEQPLLLERIKYRLESSEGYCHILAIKEMFITLDLKFSNAPENFYFGYYKIQLAKTNNENWQVCLKEILNELKKGNELYDEKGEISSMALNCILTCYDEY